MKSGVFINGERIQQTKYEESILVSDPGTGEVIEEISAASIDDVQWALESAEQAFKAWSRISAYDRAKVLHAAAGAIRTNAEEIAVLLTREQGKPLKESRGEVLGAAETFDYFAEEGTRIAGEIMVGSSRVRRDFLLWQPIGVAVAIVPWNFPLGLLSWKVAPALAAGCTIVAKPSSVAPLSSLKLIECVAKAGLPAGVFNMVVGLGDVIGTELITNPKSAVISFTGQTEVGRKIMRNASSRVKKLCLELGGNAPLIVCEDADLDEAVKGAAYKAFSNCGQVCNSINRIYVHKAVYGEFVKRFVEKVKLLRIGYGLKEPYPDLGPMTTKSGLDKVLNFIRDAVDNGATIETGGRRQDEADGKKGNYLAPCVLTNTGQSLKIVREEVFGPVAPVMEFESLEEAVKLGNDTDYGLVGYAYTKNMETSRILSERLMFGTVGINNVSGGEIYFPYAGWKQSGFGIECSPLGIREYLVPKHVRIQFQGD